MRHIRWMSGAVSSVLLVGGLGLAACENSSSGGAAPSATASTPPPASAALGAPPASASAEPAASTMAGNTPEDQVIDDELRDYHRHHRGGVTMFISMAIDTLGLDAAKKAQVEKIQSDLQAKMAPARDAERDLLSTIADGVSAGKIDTTKVDAAVAKVATASAGIHNATGDALTQLHDALSPVERQALVDKVKAQWEVWHKVNAEEKANDKAKGSRLARLTEHLNLTPDQVDKISTALNAETPVTPQSDPKPVDAYVQAFGTAFVADKFDPKALAPQATAAAGHLARHGSARMARFYEAVTPVLTPEQRTKLAAHLKERINDEHPASTTSPTPAASK